MCIGRRHEGPAALLQGWGLDVCLFLLLLAAFFSLNAISLLLMAGLALGMASSPHTRKVRPKP